MSRSSIVFGSGLQPWERDFTSTKRESGGRDALPHRLDTALFLNRISAAHRFNGAMTMWMRSGERLLETLADNLTGFDHVAEHAHRFDFYSYCEQYAQQRAQLAATFRGVMKRYGSKRPKFGSVLGSAHRFYLDIRGALDSGVVAMLEELMRGEAFLASRADALLDHDGLPEEIYEIVRLIRANTSQSLLDLRAMHHHVSNGFAAGSFRLSR
ncbi:ferritin-like domain-containing protein [Rhizorhabdus histidinilytica]|uniref:ferritin-like domain-containing protein n=1 Tax=Rhizorhabdus histidinilytica TaxID=439228 RepID=UPI00322022BF